MRYFVIGDEDAVLGFSMAGVNGCVANTVSDAEAAFDNAVSEKDVGILIVTERVAEFIRSRVDRYLFSDTFPLIIEIPDRRGRIPGKPTMRETVNAAIGVKLG